jgi:uncharacterized protein YjbI with pentapeptide repeats
MTDRQNLGSLPWDKIAIFRNATLLTCIGPMSMPVASTFFSLTSLRQASAAQPCKERFFYEATLRNVILREADLRKANLIGCDLQGADLRKADLRGANLQGANLLGANLRDAELDGAVISTDVILRFRPTVLPQDMEASAGTRTMADVYRPAS